MSTKVEQLTDNGVDIIPIAGTASTYNSAGLSVDTLLSNIQTQIENLEGLDGSNFVGIHETTASAQTQCGTLGYAVGWALVGTSLTSLTAYRVTSSSSIQLGETGAYDFTNYSNSVKYTAQTLTDSQQTQARDNIAAASASDVTNLALNIGDLSQLQTTVKTDIVSAINEILSKLS